MMSATQPPEPTVVGISPWLPWPLSAWPWCNQPVRAERLAALRIGIALCLLADIAINYAPGLRDFFLKDSLGNPSVSDWRFHAPRTTWCLFRGFEDEVNLHLSLGIWLLTSAWIIFNSFSRLALIERNLPADDRTGIALVLSTCAHAWYTAAVWARIAATKKPDDLAWVVPLAGLSLVCLYVALELSSRLRDPDHPIPWWTLGSSFVAGVILLAAGFELSRLEAYAPDDWWAPLLGSWQNSDLMMYAAMWLWAFFTVLLLIGCWAKFSAVMVWMLAMSFGNLNPNIDNAGDTIRMLILFYLMLCPCGAVWSVDGLWKTRTGPVYVHPWALRLLFFQMIFIYSMNGYYKMFGGSWLEGTSLHYVMGDLAIARFSQMLLPMPFIITAFLSWSVLVWEISFPLLMLWKWTRRPALFFGVMFHLGIFATMELAGFALYAICLYLPLVPWEWFDKAKADPANAVSTKPPASLDAGAE